MPVKVFADRVVLVAKPWRGGLARYVGMALQGLFPGCVEHLHTYPVTLKDRLDYRRDRHGWRQRLVERIDALDAELVIFLNLLPEFGVLPSKPSYVVWLTDSPQPVLDCLGPFSRVFLSDPGYAEMVRETVGSGRYAGVLPFACEPSIHVPVRFPATPTGICFIANRDAKRDAVLKYLFRHGRRVHVYGNYFLRHPLALRHPWYFRPAVGNEGMGAVYARYLASLNIHADVVRGGTNMRTFECAAYGIPQLVEYRSGLEQLFDLERELYVFRDERGLLDAIGYLEADVGEARRRANRAREHVLAEHTYGHRIRHILASL